MATTAATGAGQARPKPQTPFARDNRFYNRLTIALSVVILLAFALFNMAGLTDWSGAPSVTYTHAALMIVWLALFAAQGLLGAGRHMRWHRPLGWAGAGLAAVVVITGLATGMATVATGRTPPFFSDAYFLSLTTVQPVLFGLIFAAAIALRRKTDWHRRLMLGSLLLIAEPAFGRLIPLILVPALGGPEAGMASLLEMREWIPLMELTLQLALLALAMRHDKRLHGAVHRAHLWTLGALIALPTINKLLEAVPAYAAYAGSLAAG